MSEKMCADCSKDNMSVGKCWRCGYFKNFIKHKWPQNLEQPDAYSLLGEVIDDWISDLEAEDIYMLPKLIEKMKDFRVKHFNEHIEY